MNRTTPEIILACMQSRTWYRPLDIAESCGIPPSTARYALRRLARGGVIEAFKEPRRTCYITRQLALF